MKFSIIATVVALASFATALPTEKRADPDTFKLKPGPDAPSEIAGLGFVQWDNSIPGFIGWFPTDSDAKGVETFIQYNAEKGIAFYARDTAMQIYLIEDETSADIAKIGNPSFEDSTVVVYTENFSVNTDVDGNQYFGYDNDYDGAWIACGSDGTYTLEFGHTSRPGCTESFSLQTEHVPFWGST